MISLKKKPVRYTLGTVIHGVFIPYFSSCNYQTVMEIKARKSGDYMKLRKQYQYTTASQLINNISGIFDNRIFSTLENGAKVIISISENCHLNIYNPDTGILLSEIWISCSTLERLFNLEYLAH